MDCWSMTVYKLQIGLVPLPCLKNTITILNWCFQQGWCPKKLSTLASYLVLRIFVSSVCLFTTVLLVIKCNVSPMIKCKGYSAIMLVSINYFTDIRTRKEYLQNFPANINNLLNSLGWMEQNMLDCAAKWHSVLAPLTATETGNY